MDFEPCAADTVCDIGDSVSFREHVGDFLTGFNVPLWDIVLFHHFYELLFFLVVSRLSKVSFSGEFHNGESIGVFHSVNVVKHCHDVVTAGDDIF